MFRSSGQGVPQVLGAVGFDVPVSGTFTLAASADDDDRVISTARPTTQTLPRRVCGGPSLDTLSGDFNVDLRFDLLRDWADRCSTDAD